MPAVEPEVLLWEFGVGLGGVKSVSRACPDQGPFGAATPFRAPLKVALGLLLWALFGTGCTAAMQVHYEGVVTGGCCRASRGALRVFLNQRVGHASRVQSVKLWWAVLHYVFRTLSMAMCVLCGDMVLQRRVSAAVQGCNITSHAQVQQPAYWPEKPPCKALGFQDCTQRFLPSYMMVPVPSHPRAGPRNPTQITYSARVYSKAPRVLAFCAKTAAGASVVIQQQPGN